MREELFRSETMAVRRVGARGGTVIITFGSYTNEAVLDRAGFAEEFLEREGIDAIHVINRYNQWYQHPDRAEILSTIAAAVRPYGRAITYGSSMGGYAALRYAASCGADTAVALSPQFSVDPRVVPWEIRWQADVVRTHFDEPRYVPAAHQYVFFDPRVSLDRRHVDLIAQVGATHRIAIPYGGHPVGALLVETGALQAAIRGIVAGDFDPAGVRRQVRRERSASQHQFFVLARHCTVRHPALAVRLLERASEIEPESHILSARAVLLDRLGRSAEAGPLHRAAIDRTPANTLAWMGYAGHLETTGDAEGAAAALRQAAPREAGSMLLRVRVMQIRLWLRRRRLRLLDRAFERVIGWIERSRFQGAILRRLGAGLR